MVHNHFNLDWYFNSQPEDQSEEGRHLCAGCAYILGYHYGYNNLAYSLDDVLNMIPFSQAQPQRHHDPKRAANDGYNLGRTDRKLKLKAKYSITEIQSYLRKV